MYKKRLDIILENIKQQRIDKYNESNSLTTEKKQIIYHKIIKNMVEGKNEYSLEKYGTESILKEYSLQKQINKWLRKEHGLECVRKYVDLDDWSNDLFYYVVIW